MRKAKAVARAAVYKRPLTQALESAQHITYIFAAALFSLGLSHFFTL